MSELCHGRGDRVRWDCCAPYDHDYYGYSKRTFVLYMVTQRAGQAATILKSDMEEQGMLFVSSLPLPRLNMHACHFYQVQVCS